jgi:hypothetical protein
LNEALTILGFKSVHYPTDEKTVQELMGGKRKLTLLENHDAITDITPVPFFKELDELYDAKFILTVREKRAWLASVGPFWDTVLINGKWNELVDLYISGDWPAHFNQNMKRYLRFTFFLHAAVFGQLKFTVDGFGRAWDEHIAKIQEHFKYRNNLLVLDVTQGDGWEKLCPFLGRPIPKHPFPHENRRPHVKIL